MIADFIELVRRSTINCLKKETLFPQVRFSHFTCLAPQMANRKELFGLLVSSLFGHSGGL